MGLALWAGPRRWGPPPFVPTPPLQQPPHTSGTLALAMGVVTTIRARHWAKLLEV